MMIPANAIEGMGSAEQQRDAAFYTVQNLSCPFDLMRFYLVYRGPLSAMQRKASTRKPERIEIRKQITPQLEKLWSVSPALKRLRWNARVPGRGTYTFGSGDSPLHAHYEKNDPDKSPLQEGFVDLSAPVERHGHVYRPLVRKSLDLTCSLDVLFLRQEEPGSLRKDGGDLDNRIKTFLDALEMPPEHGEPDGDETDGVNYRLFENDTLVRGLNIDSERLLLPERDFPNQVHLVVEVTIHVESIGAWNVSLVG